MVIVIVFLCILVSLALVFLRLARGHNLPVRVVALDMMVTLVVGFIAVDAIVAEQPVFIDAAIVLALLGFIGTVAFAFFIEKGIVPWWRL